MDSVSLRAEVAPSLNWVSTEHSSPPYPQFHLAQPQCLEVTRSLKRKIPEIHSSCAPHCTPRQSFTPSLSVPTLCPVWPCLMCYLPVSRSVAIQAIRPPAAASQGPCSSHPCFGRAMVLGTWEEPLMQFPACPGGLGTDPHRRGQTTALRAVTSNVTRGSADTAA